MKDPDTISLEENKSFFSKIDFNMTGFIFFAATIHSFTNLLVVASIMDSGIDSISSSGVFQIMFFINILGLFSILLYKGYPKGKEALIALQLIHIGLGMFMLFLSAMLFSNIWSTLTVPFLAPSIIILIALFLIQLSKSRSKKTTIQ